MVDIDTSDRKEQRKFGIVMAVALAVLGAIRWGLGYWLHPETAGAYPLPFLYVAAPFLVLGIVWPRALQPVFVAWMKFALALNWLMTRIMLTIAWFALFIPTRVILRLAGKPMLKRAWEPESASYWEEPEDQPDDLDRYRHQF